uniref:Uncharacterized protein n=1 Tax=Physcomitrium patens TaxID=3218 RepID=A0A2K1L7B0_PHYPA|nr:hypothetical protein PHYPA_000352 [Physcomitrium patens]
MRSFFICVRISQDLAETIFQVFTEICLGSVVVIVRTSHVYRWNLLNLDKDLSHAL